MEKILFITGVIIINTGILMSAKSSVAQDNQQTAGNKAAGTVIETPASAKGLTTFNIKEKEEEYIIIRDKEKIVHFFVNYKRIPNEELSAYSSVIKKLDVQTRRGMEEAEHMKAPELPPPPADYAGAENGNTTPEMQPANETQRKRDQEQMNTEEALARRVINDLIKEGVLKNSQSLAAFVLTNDVMVVNRRQLSGPIHERFKARYLKSPGDMVNLALSNFK